MTYQVILQTANETVARRFYELAKTEAGLALLMQATNPKLPGMMTVVESYETKGAPK